MDFSNSDNANGSAPMVKEKDCIVLNQMECSNFKIVELYLQDAFYTFKIENKISEYKENIEFRFIFENKDGKLRPSYDVPPNQVFYKEDGIIEVEADFIIFDELKEDGKWYLTEIADGKKKRIDISANIKKYDISSFRTSMYYKFYEKSFVPTITGDYKFYLSLQEEHFQTEQNVWIESSVVSQNKLNISLKNAVLPAFENANIVCINTKLALSWAAPVDMEDLRNQKIQVEFKNFLEEAKAVQGNRFKVYLELFYNGQSHLYRLQNLDYIQRKVNKNDKYKMYCEDIQMGNIEDVPVSLLPYYSYKEGLLNVVLLSSLNLLNEMLVAKLKKITLKGSILSFDVVCANYDFSVKNVFVKFRSKLEEIEHSMDFTVKPLGHNRVKISAQIDLSRISFKQTYWDFGIVFEKNNREYRIKIKSKERFLRYGFYIRDMAYYTEDEHAVFPYFAKGASLALQYRNKSKYDGRDTQVKEILALITYYLLKPYWDHKHVWLVYEKFCLMAQDNSYYFFKYCMENLSEAQKKNIYYVIDKEAPDYENIKQYDSHILDFMSFKHCLYYKIAKLYISTDTKNHGYAWRTKNSILKATLKRKKIAFLQHGVTAFKKVDTLFGKFGSSKMNLFFTTSQFEQSIVLDNFGYNLKEIPVTGFARWDVLEDKQDPADKQILLMPTWRGWLEEVDDEEFVQSDYYKNYTELLNNEALLAELKKKKTKLVFYIHPKFRDYIANFSICSEQVELIPFGEQPLNELMMKCSLLITDYSSVAWDVYYLEKPVVFYQFDYENYNIAHGSYIDMKTDLFGERAEALDSLVTIVNEYLENDCKEKEKYKNMREKLFAFRDDKNSKRIYDALIQRNM